MKKRNTGFTLVELIVVIVILAILAAILVPALLGYIDRAKEELDMFKAKNMLTATQAELTEYYAHDDKPQDGRKNDYDVSTPFATKVRQTADDDPYLVIIGIGRDDDPEMTKHDQYTAYFVCYWETKDKEPLFFNGSEWSLDYPWAEGQSGKDYNYFTVNGQRKHLTFIFVANKTGESNPWGYLQNTLKANKRGRADKDTTSKNGK